MNKKYIFVIFIILLAGIFFISESFLNLSSYFSRQKNIPGVDKQTSQELTQDEITDIPLLSTVATNLNIPWAIAFLPNGNLLVTERTGHIQLISNDTNTEITSIDVKNIGEGGLHGIALHPEYESNNFVYIYYTYDDAGEKTKNRVSRFIFDGKSFSDEEIIVNEIPGAIYHDGGRIKFGPDGYLYITTGDAQDSPLAQNLNSLAGKILRVTDSGETVSDNLFGNLIYSYGHRNPQGLTWDNQGRLWETEHGQSATDELNLVEIGKNYGWPTIRGDESLNGLQSPIAHSDSDTWAPAGVAYLDGSIFFTGLRGQAMYEYKINNPSREVITHLKDQLGRLREIVVGPDNMLYITTSNRDGRGFPTSEDDRIIRVNPNKL